MKERSILWFRHGLRLHDNPALLEAIKSDGVNKTVFYPVFIFDGFSAGTQHVGYNRMKFLTESLADLDEQFRQYDGKLFIFRGDPVEIFKQMHQHLGITKICFEQDCEPIWNNRDTKVRNLCDDLGIEVVERISHTLWDPMKIIQVNGGFPPLTYQMFLHTVNVLGLPSRPCEFPNFVNVSFGEIPQHLNEELQLMDDIPVPEDFGICREKTRSEVYLKWKGGERKALEQLISRLKVEQDAFCKGTYLPNQANPDLLGTSKSMSAALRFGCLSVRKFYYAIHDLFIEVQENLPNKYPGGHHITGQLIWREYFYTMSVKNLNYGRMKDNPICLNIPWGVPDENDVLKWKQGRTGFPIIDASMRQLLAEGWLHHTLRNITATFLTRSGLWLSWEIGLKHFLKYLLDADWSVCAGNWMWVSSSAFEKLLDSSKFSILHLAYQLDPNGDFVKRYIPELRHFPRKFIHEPWRAPIQVQEACECIIGENYPTPMIDYKRSMQINSNRMKEIRDSLIDNKPHVRPSNEDEIRTFFWINDDVSVKV